MDSRAGQANSRRDLLWEPRRCRTPDLGRPGTHIRMACRVRKNAKYHHGRGNGDRKRLDRDDRSVSLFERAEVGLARPGKDSSKATRKSMACPPPRTPG